MKKRCLWLGILTLISICNLVIADEDQMAIWDFGAPSAINYTETVTSEDVEGTPTIIIDLGDKDTNGKDGTAYTDIESVNHASGQAAAWNDVAKSGDNDARWTVTINTTGWENLSIRWDYKAWTGDEEIESFDLKYNISDPEQWVSILNNQPITVDENFHSFTKDLSSISAIENASFVQFRMDDLEEGTGNGKFAFDNLEITGEKIIPNPLSISFDETGFSRASGVKDDSTDPLTEVGIDFTIANSGGSLDGLTVTKTSTNTSAISLTTTPNETAGSYTLFVEPLQVCYNETITVTVSDGTNSQSISFQYSASESGSVDNPPNDTARYYTNMSDASTAIVVNSDYMLVGNDEDEELRLYDRDYSGSPIPITGANVGSSLGLISDGGEVDIEASMRIGNKIYWIGSHGNNKDGKCRPNRSRLFATTISGTGSDITLTFAGYYANLRTKLINWDFNGDHGKGDDYYDLDGCAYCAESGGVAPKNENGFNIEGLTMAPDDETAYICFRAPLVGTDNRALIVPITGGSVSGTPTYTTFESWFSNRATADPIFGDPIELDLGGRGIRSIEKNDSDEYLIVAGSYGDTGVAPHDFRLYMWTGNANDNPVLLLDDMTDLVGTEDGRIEGIVGMPSVVLNSNVQFVLDNGVTKWYGTSNPESKLLADEFQKFRSDWFEDITTDSGMIAYWPFTEGTGTTTRDAVGSNDASVDYIEWSTYGISGNCLSLNGVTDYADCGNGEDLRATSDTTVTAWFRSDDISGDHVLVSKSNNDGQDRYILRVLDGQLKCYKESNNDGGIILIGGHVSNFKWHFASVTMGSSGFKLYLDGVLVDSSTDTNVLQNGTHKPLYIGMKFAFGYNDMYPADLLFEGKIDEVKVYDKCLSATELLNIYKNKIDNLVANPSFRDQYVIPSGYPYSYGSWGGDDCLVVGTSDSITPHDGPKMLKFRYTGWSSPDSAISSQLYQIIDVSPYSDLVSSGDATATASAYFNRVAGDAETDTKFYIGIGAYTGDPANFHPTLTRIAYATTDLYSDSNINTWESAQVELDIPTNADYIVISLNATEDIYNDISGTEFDGHYADDVYLEIN